MMKWKPFVAAGLSIWTAACGTFGLNRSPAPILVQQRLPVPPVECTTDPPPRLTFQPPEVSPQVTTGPALAIMTSRAERAETVLAPALDHIDADRVQDANVDGVAQRCAAWNREHLTDTGE